MKDIEPEMTEKLVVIITKTKSPNGGSVINIEKVGDRELWFEIKVEVLEHILADYRMKGLK